MLKVLIVVAAGILTALAFRQIMSHLQLSKARVRTTTQQQPGPKRLRQDAKTGIYYPED